MLSIVHEVGEKLEQGSGLPLPDPTICYIATPEQAEVINRGALGATYRNMVIIGLTERQLSQLALVATHELAHVLSYRLGDYETPFKGEGFACYMAASTGIDPMPCGLPVHYYPKWLLSTGVELPLVRLWQRWDYSPELYDLAWSFASFFADRFSRERYFAFYSARAKDLNERLIKIFGVPTLALQEQWSDYVWERVGTDPSQIREMHRYVGMVCSRALWLKQR